MFCRIGESILTNVFLNGFRLIQRICLAKGVTAEVVLAEAAGALPNMHWHASLEAMLPCNT
jgi:hypothetical protein